MEFRFDLRVYYEDTDAGGIVYHANYLKFTERARTEMLRELGFSNIDLAEKDGLFIVVRHIDVDYYATSHLEDDLQVRSSLIDIRNTSFTLQQDIYRGDHIVCGQKVRLVCISRDKKPVPIPPALKDALLPYMKEG